MDATGLVHHRLGPLPEAVQHLGWADGGPEAGACLVACTPQALFTWMNGGADPGPVISCPEGAKFCMLATSQRSRFLAAACDACKVGAADTFTPPIFSSSLLVWHFIHDTLNPLTAFLPLIVLWVPCVCLFIASLALLITMHCWYSHSAGALMEHGGFPAGWR